MTVTIPTDDLARTLQLAAACTDRTGRNAIRLESGGGVLTATGATGPILGHARTLSADGALPGDGIVITATAARRLAHDIDRRQPLRDIATLTVDGNHLHVRAYNDYRNPINTTIPIETAPWLRVDYRPLLDSVPAGAVGTGQPMFFTPEQMAVFADVSRIVGSAMCRWTILGPDQPIRVEVSDVLVMLIAPGHPSPVAFENWPIPVGLPNLAEVPGDGTEADRG
jgi:hypothetical protein